MVAVIRKYYLFSIFVSFAIVVLFIMFTNQLLLLCIASDDSDYDAVVAFTLPNLQSIWTNSAEKGTHNLRDVL